MAWLWKLKLEDRNEFQEGIQMNVKVVYGMQFLLLSSNALRRVALKLSMLSSF